MPIYITDPDGQKHEFADGTSYAAINAEMDRRWAERGQPKPPQGQPLQQPGNLPPGTVPGRMQSQAGAPDASMVPLSEEAERAMALMRWKALQGDRGGVQGAYDLVQADTTYQTRKKQAEKMGEDAADTAAKQKVGTKILPGIARLRNMVEEITDKDWDAIGGAKNPVKMRPSAEVPYSPGAYFAPEMTPTQARAAYSWNPWHAADYQRQWGHQNELTHLIDALTEQNVASGGKNVGGSDSRMELLREVLMRAMMAPNKAEAQRILNSAEYTTRNIFGLPSAEGVDGHQSSPHAEQRGQPFRQQFRNKQTGAIETFERQGNEWVKVP